MYPLIAAIGVVCTIGVYASVRQMTGNPEVHFSRGARGAAPWERPDTDEQAEAWAKRIVKNQRHIDSACGDGEGGGGEWWEGVWMAWKRRADVQLIRVAAQRSSSPHPTPPPPPPTPQSPADPISKLSAFQAFSPKYWQERAEVKRDALHATMGGKSLGVALQESHH